MAFIDGYDGKYNMVKENCTTFAVKALQAAGITPPTSKHKWTLPEGTKQMIMDNLPGESKLAWGGKEKVAQDLMDALYGYTPADAMVDMMD